MPIITVQVYQCPKCGHQEPLGAGDSSCISRSTELKVEPLKGAPPAFSWADGPTRQCAICGGTEGRCYLPVPGRNGTELGWRCTNPECESRKKEEVV